MRFVFTSESSSQSYPLMYMYGVIWNVSADENLTGKVIRWNFLYGKVLVMEEISGNCLNYMDRVERGDEADPPRPNGWRSNIRWSLPLQQRRRHETVPEPFSYPAQKFLHARDRCRHQRLHSSGIRRASGHRREIRRGILERQRTPPQRMDLWPPLVPSRGQSSGGALWRTVLLPSACTCVHAVSTHVHTPIYTRM
jgi:hypothetical protein